MNPFLQIQLDARARLDAWPDLAGVPILTEDPEDPLNEAFKNLYKGALPIHTSGRTGIALVLQTVAARNADETGTELLIAQITLRVVVYELILLNRDPQAGIGKSGLAVIWGAIAALHGWKPFPSLAAVEFVAFDLEPDETRPVLAYFADFHWTRGISA